VAAVGLVLVGCGGPKPAPVAVAAKPTLPVDPWILYCNDPAQTEPALLWNGLIGVRIGRSGMGLTSDEKPLPFFAIDRYEQAGEEKIKTLPNPLQFVADEASNEFYLRDPQNYIQKLDMKTGLLTTEWDTKDATAVSGPLTHIRCEVVMHPTQAMMAVRWTAVPGRDADITFGVVRNPADPGVGNPTSVVKNGVENYSKLGSEDLKWSLLEKSSPSNAGGVNVKKGQVYEGEATWSFGLKGKDPVRPLAYRDVLSASTKIWAERWKTDIEISGPTGDQQAIHSFLFYLRSAIHPDGGMSISPYGLSNSQYFGHVFWDADTWVFPALALIDPQSAEAIIKYRGLREKAAKENYQAWLKAGRPLGQGSLGPPAKSITDWPGLMYPWESSVSGHETVPGPSKYEHHITGSVARASKMAESLGFQSLDVDTLWIVREAAEFYLNRVQKGSDGLYDLKGTMSPDENHTGDNDLYTNILAQQVMDDALWKYSADVRPKLRLPKDDKSFLTYDNDALRGYKQAAAVLAIYPLQYPPAEKQAKAMMERFADKVSTNGPAMTDSIHSIIWSRIGERDKAYDAWHASWVPFTQSPLSLFSEKRSKQTTYFTTGAAGSLQSVLYGFLGIRLDYVKEPGAAWATPLATGGWLSIKPNLPRQWNSVKFKNFNVLGRRYSLTVTQSTATVAPGD